MKKQIRKMLAILSLTVFVVSTATVAAFAALTQVDAEGGVWTYGTRNGECTSIYFHATRRHYANVINGNGATSTRVYADANANAQATVADIGTCKAYYGF